MPLRTNNQRKKELRELHNAGRLTYVEERTDPRTRRKVWDIVVNGKPITLTTQIVDGFLMAARELGADGAVDGEGADEDREEEPAGAGV